MFTRKKQYTQKQVESLKTSLSLAKTSIHDIDQALALYRQMHTIKNMITTVEKIQEATRQEVIKIDNTFYSVDQRGMLQITDTARISEESITYSNNK